MTAASTLAAGRRAAERLMVDTVRISTVGDGVLDEATGAVTAALTTVYEGKGRIQTYEPYEHTADAAGHTFTTQRYAVHVPVESCAPAVGMVVDVVTATHDANLVGRRYRVVALLHKSLATAYRLGVEEVAA